jgi:hypothetical protein
VYILCVSEYVRFSSLFCSHGWFGLVLLGAWPVESLMVARSAEKKAIRNTVWRSRDTSRKSNYTVKMVRTAVVSTGSKKKRNKVQVGSASAAGAQRCIGEQFTAGNCWWYSPRRLDQQVPPSSHRAVDIVDDAIRTDGGGILDG